MPGAPNRNLLSPSGSCRSPLFHRGSSGRAAHDLSEPRTQRSGVSGSTAPPLTPLRCVRGSDIPPNLFLPKHASAYIAKIVDFARLADESFPQRFGEARLLGEVEIVTQPRDQAVQAKSALVIGAAVLHHKFAAEHPDGAQRISLLIEKPAAHAGPRLQAHGQRLRFRAPYFHAADQPPSVVDEVQTLRTQGIDAVDAELLARQRLPSLPVHQIAYAHIGQRLAFRIQDRALH